MCGIRAIGSGLPPRGSWLCWVPCKYSPGAITYSMIEKLGHVEDALRGGDEITGNYRNLADRPSIAEAKWLAKSRRR